MSTLTHRTLGTTLVAALAVVGAVVSVAAGIVLSGTIDVDARLGAPSSYLTVDAATTTFLLVVGAAQGLFAWGALTLGPWVWTFGVVTQSAGLVGAFCIGAAGAVSVWQPGLAGGIHALILAYLMTPEARRAFQPLSARRRARRADSPQT